MRLTGCSSVLDGKKRFQKHQKIVSSPKVKLLKAVSFKVNWDLKVTAQGSVSNLCETYAEPYRIIMFSLQYPMTW